jgi:hypothetical protein
MISITGLFSKGETRALERELPRLHELGTLAGMIRQTEYIYELL